MLAICGSRQKTIQSSAAASCFLKRSPAHQRSGSVFILACWKFFNGTENQSQWPEVSQKRELDVGTMPLCATEDALLLRVFNS